MKDNVCDNNGNGGNGAGIHVTSTQNRIEGNHLIDNERGLDIDNNSNYVADNTVRGNTDNYDIAGGNQLNLLLGELPETIDWPANVKLAGTLTCSSTATDGISVNADDVTIDLAGHSLVGPGSGSGHGIYQSDAYRNLTVCNGKISEWRGTSKGGVYVVGSAVHAFNLQSSLNNYGFRVGPDGVISDCIADENSSVGIYLSGATGTCNDGSIIGCTIVNNGNYGVYLYGDGADCNGTRVERCTISQNANWGMYIRDSDENLILNCILRGNTGRGITTAGANRNRIEGCHVSGTTGATTHGIRTASGEDNLVIKNSSMGHTTNYSPDPDDCYGPIITASGTITESNPWANFGF